MAQLTYVGQGQLSAFGPLLATAMLLVSLVFALLGIKFWGFRRRLTFDRGPAAQQQQSQPTSQSQQPPRYAAYESQVNGTDTAVHGVFRQRNTEEFESTRPTNSAGPKYLTGSVPNLSLASLAPRERKEVPTIPELAGPVPHRTGSDPQAARRRRREVYSANYEYYSTPPTREPPTPPVAAAAAAAPAPAPVSKAAIETGAQQLDIPNFDHFAEKYELISAKPAGNAPEPRQSTQKENGRYVKYEQVDDVPELLTPDDDQAGAPISVAAMVHNVPQTPQPTMEPEPKLAPIAEPRMKVGPRAEPRMEQVPKAEPRLELGPIAEPRIIIEQEPQPVVEPNLQIIKDIQPQLSLTAEPRLTMELSETEVEDKFTQKQELELNPKLQPELLGAQQPKLEPQVELSTNRNSRIIEGQLLPLEHTDSAFVVEIIAGTPDAIEQTTEPVIAPKLFDDLELLPPHQDPEFELKRSSYEMNEADILDMQPDFSGLQLEPAPRSPPGFGKSIDEDWENFENLDHVTELPEPNWSVHPAILESPLSEHPELELQNVVQQETLFQELELMEPAVEAPPTEPPPYEARLPPLPILPDYESLMQQEKLKTPRNLPKYADVVGQNRTNGTKYVSSIEDLFGELNGDAPTSSSRQVRNFEELCEELEIGPSPVPARRAPQPAPRVSKPATLSARGDAPPLTCYAPEELPNSSSSEEETADPLPQPAKRQRHVRFDVENLQYYQSAEVVSSNESEVDYESAEDVEESETELPPRTMQRLIALPAELEADVPRLFGTQVSQEESDDDGAFGRAIRQHRTMTEALRPVVQLERNSDRGTEA